MYVNNYHLPCKSMEKLKRTSKTWHNEIKPRATCGVERHIRHSFIFKEAIKLHGESEKAKGRLYRNISGKQAITLVNTFLTRPSQKHFRLCFMIM